MADYAVSHSADLGRALTMDMLMLPCAGGSDVPVPDETPLPTPGYTTDR